MTNQTVLLISIIGNIILFGLVIVFRSNVKQQKEKLHSAEERVDRLFKKEKDLQQSFNAQRALLEKTISEFESYKALNDKREESLKIILSGHLKAYPYLAAIMADYTTYDIKLLAEQLNWGNNAERKKKVISINQIRASANERIAEARVATYQLNYLLSLYPVLEDVLDSEEYNELDYSDKGYLQNADPVRQYVSKEEWDTMSENERNQKALDNYIQSHSKSKWQIGRDFELYIGYLYGKKGFDVTYYGENKGLEDLGRDLICIKDGKTQIVQCKYWGKDKQIHEKHIFQLFATTVSYCIDNHYGTKDVSPVFVTNISLSEEARRVAKQLNVTYIENVPMGDFPRIKCNNGTDEFGCSTKIYHLPMDQQYDRVKLAHDGDMMAYTVREAVSAGYRRAYKWSPGK
ncbi:MAG: restriction endonuclease [Clostridia bacterium]|nr:restriction endonuclease [Clostridia bacterium]